jgi:hypothetical protein
MRRMNVRDKAPGNYRVDFGRGLRCCNLLVTTASWSSFALTRISEYAAVRGLSLGCGQAPCCVPASGTSCSVSRDQTSSQLRRSLILRPNIRHEKMFGKLFGRAIAALATCPSQSHA